MPGVNGLIVNDDDGTATFDYLEDDSLYAMTLIYTDYSDVCMEDSSVTSDVNVDFIDADFTVNPSVICKSSGEVLLDNSPTQVDNDSYTFNWDLFYNSDTLSSVHDSLNPTFSLPSPGLYDIKLEVISSTGCSDVLDLSEAVRVTGDTEFTVSKLFADSSELLLPDSIDILLCNDDRILLKNTSIHRLECPECFSWDLPGVNGLIVNDTLGTAAFDYPSDDSLYLMSLIYNDYTGVCMADSSVIKDVNVDYIDANFNIDASVICKSSGEVFLDNSPTQVDNDSYTFNWDLFYNSDTLSSVQDSLNPTFSLPSPGLYDIKLEVISSTGCSDGIDSLNVVRVTGDTEFTISNEIR